MTQTALAELLAADLSGLDLVCLMVDGVHFGEHCCVVALGIDHRRDQAPAGAGRGLHRERHPGPRAAGRPARARPGRHPADPVRASTAPRRCAARSWTCSTIPCIARCQQHKLRNVRDKLPQRLRRPGRAAHARRLPRRLRPGRRGPAGHAGPRARQDPPGRRGEPARGAGRDPDGAAAGRAADPGPHAALHEHHRVDDLDLPRARRQRQALAGRHDGAALVRRRDGRGRQAVPPRQRLPAPAGPARRAGGRGRRRLSPAHARIRRWKRPDDHRGRHRSSTELGTSSRRTTQVNLGFSWGVGGRMPPITQGALSSRENAAV